MTNEELQDALSEFGPHLEVRVLVERANKTQHFVEFDVDVDTSSNGQVETFLAITVDADLDALR